MEHMDFHLHPMLVHFPIALFTGAVLMEVLAFISRKDQFHQTAVHMYLWAVIMTPLVVQTGLWEEGHLKIKHKILEIHETFALAAMWGSLIFLPFLYFVHKRNGGRRNVLFLICFLAVAGLVAVAAYNGGRMVYEYGVGVES